jgi:hypothetical protein
MYNDSIVDEVRKVRESLAKKYDYDVGAIFEDLLKRQGMLGIKLVQRKRKEVIKKAPALDRDATALHPGR